MVKNRYLYLYNENKGMENIPQNAIKYDIIILKKLCYNIHIQGDT